MSTLGDSFDRAQRQYDNQLPPEPDEYDTCPECDGEGKLDESDCCGAPILKDNSCAECGEVCELAICTNCDGKGEINLEVERQAAYEEYLERKAEEHREERMMDHLNNIKDKL